MNDAVPSDGVVRYASVRRDAGAKCALTCRPVTAPAAATPGTLEHFLAERYLLFADTRRGLCRGQVHHTPYPLQRAEVTEWDESLLAAAGIARPAGEPIAHYAEGVRVEIFGLHLAKLDVRTHARDLADPDDRIREMADAVSRRQNASAS